MLIANLKQSLNRATEVNRSEVQAEKFLTSLGIGIVAREPLGKGTAPDFSIGGRIAVEVTRLNQHFEHLDGRTEGLENVDTSMWKALTRTLPNISPSLDGKSWWVGVSFSRPMRGSWKELLCQIELALREFLALEPHPDRTAIKITDNLDLDLSRAGSDLGHAFKLGASSDDDSGGFVLHELEKNLKICIAKKNEDLPSYREKFDECWLVLDDHIDYGSDDEERTFVREEIMPRIPNSFDRIIVIDPRGTREAFVAYP